MLDLAPRAPALERALDTLADAGLAPGEQLEAALSRLRGGAGPLAAFEVGDERSPSPHCIDGRLLEAICHRALGGAHGAVFTPRAEAIVLAAFGLAHAAAVRDRDVDASAGVAALLGVAPVTGALRAALDGLRVLDFACGGGALLAAAASLASRAGIHLRLAGADVSPLAVRATAARLDLLSPGASVRVADAIAEAWPAADLVIANPPFVRHEVLPRATKAMAALRSGLSRQADLSAHLAALAIRHAPVVALVAPRALDTSRSAGPWRDDARARGGFVLRLRSSLAGSFAANVDTRLCAWVEGARDEPEVEASVPLEALGPAELAGLARRCFAPTLRPRVASAAPPRGARRVADVADVRFGMKSGANAFFHLVPLARGVYRSGLGGAVELADSDVAPLLASLKEARAPASAEPERVLFRPREPTRTAAAYIALGESLGVNRRATCAGRKPWWHVAPARAVAPVLYPAKIGARAFAFLNAGGLCEDKKWHALFPRDLDPWLLAAVLGATPLRLAIDVAARQLTGAQAIADVDCRVLAAAPFPAAAALERAEPALDACWRTLARDPVSTRLEEMLDRPAQRELDAVVGHALGLAASAVEGTRRELLARVRSRLAHAAHVRRNTPTGSGVRQPGLLPGHASGRASSP